MTDHAVQASLGVALSSAGACLSDGTCLWRDGVPGSGTAAEKPLTTGKIVPTGFTNYGLACESFDPDGSCYLGLPFLLFASVPSLASRGCCSHQGMWWQVPERSSR